ncbi:hypothetical protein QAD02_011551 [Eretmocerus hayati]|uniref:Uncharacterized protein n=1 Tax=Eretmocerus hayati TaxID=131215 RepID=A0ACC2P1X1_9HYME|nr:hypothetical protein QAD02_011551 [Eretmocerus hayati]
MKLALRKIRYPEQQTSHHAPGSSTEVLFPKRVIGRALTGLETEDKRPAKITRTSVESNLFVREPTPPIETVLQVLTPPGFQNMDVSQAVVLNPNEQFDASDIVQADIE